MQELTDIGRVLELKVTQIKFTLPEMEELLFYIFFLYVDE